MAITIASVQTFTDAELLILYRNCAALIATGQQYSMNGRMMTRADLPEVREMIDWLEARINAAAEPENAGLGLAGYGERV